MAGRLAGKVAIITGATSGIGEATARCFAEAGAKLLIAGRTKDKGDALARELGEHVVFQTTDVTREADIAALVDTAMSRFGRLDCMFNNAGASTPGTLDTVTEQELASGLQLLAGIVVLPMLVAGYVRGSRESRELTQDFAIMLVAIVGCGVGIDTFHRFITNHHLDALVSMIEDGGEMVLLSATVFYAMQWLRGRIAVKYRPVEIVAGLLMRMRGQAASGTEGP